MNIISIRNFIAVHATDLEQFGHQDYADYPGLGAVPILYGL